MIRFRIIFIAMTILSLLLILTPQALGLASAILTYHGKCYGFTDGSWVCTWQAYAADQMSWSALVDIPLSMVLIPGWLMALGLWVFKCRTPATNGLPLSLVMLIPLGGCLGGACLISILPVFIRLFYNFFP
jgi:hypothetical protein